jgi:hypothetical protein
VRWATEGFTDHGRSFPAGTLLVPAAARGALAPLTGELGIVARAVETTPLALALRTPRVGLYQSWVASMDEGWTRYVFDTFNAPYESLRDAGLSEGNLQSRFDAIVLPSEQTRPPADNEAPPAEGGRGIGDKGYVSLARFVEDGGTLICFDGSCAPLIKQWQLPLKNVLEGLRSVDFYCPGSILGINVDNLNPIARTMSKDANAYFINSSAFELTDPPRPLFDAPRKPWPVHVIARYAKDNLLRSGWLRGEDRIKDKIALAEVTMGKGRVVLFAFRPQHRGQTWGTFPFIWNAINLQ